MVCLIRQATNYLCMRNQFIGNCNCITIILCILVYILSCTCKLAKYRNRIEATNVYRFWWGYSDYVLATCVLSMDWSCTTQDDMSLTFFHMVYIYHMILFTAETTITKYFAHILLGCDWIWQLYYIIICNYKSVILARCHKLQMNYIPSYAKQRH